VNQVIAGAATCFYSFVGFDTIATSGEESTKPTKHVPIAIITTLVICLLAYVGVSSVLTLIVPFSELADTAALPKAFAQRGIPGAEYVIAVGGLCGLTASIMGSIFPLPRGVYAMAQDGLVFRWLGHVNKWTDTPLLATLISGFLVALSALLFDLNSLIEMMSIGTLMAYTLVAISVLVLHYQREQVGLTAADSDPHSENTRRPIQFNHASNGNISEALASGGDHVSLSEDTGLLRVGDGSSRVRYVPTKTTTVVKRIKPPTDSDEEQQLPPSTPPPALAATLQPQKSLTQQASVVDEYRAKVQLQQQQQQQQQRLQAAEAAAAAAEIAATRAANEDPPGSTYQRIDSSYSVGSLSQLFNAGGESAATPTGRTRRVVVWSLSFVVLIWTSFCVLTIYGESHLLDAVWWAVALACVMLAAILTLIILIVKQPLNTAKLNFSTPFVPLLPLASIMINIYLMITLSVETWIRFAIWMSAGQFDNLILIL